jgi:hypothetical protein
MMADFLDSRGRRVPTLSAYVAKMDRSLVRADFAEAIDKAGMVIVRTNAADLPALDELRRKDELAASTGAEASGQRFAKLEAGDFAAVPSRGNVFKLNPHKLDFEEIEQRLADTQRRMPSVIEARASFEIKAELRAADQANRTAAWTARAEAVTAQLPVGSVHYAGRRLNPSTKPITSHGHLLGLLGCYHAVRTTARQQAYALFSTHRYS